MNDKYLNELEFVDEVWETQCYTFGWKPLKMMYTDRANLVGSETFPLQEPPTMHAWTWSSEWEVSYDTYYKPF